MFVQFRAHYPTGSLISELMAIQNGTYIVRVVIQVGGATLATGMAAAEQLERAEDQARLRALEALGLFSSPPAYSNSAYALQVQLMENPENRSSLPQSQHEPPEALGASYSTPALSLPEQQISPSPPIPAVSQASSSQESTELDSDSDYLGDSHPAMQSPPPRTDSRRSAAGRGGKAQSERNGRSPRREVQAPPLKSSSPEPTDLPRPIDLSDVIAQTTVEMKRLGWTEAEGRSYLQRTYGKRSRQKLTDEELFEFLEYLESQSSPDESPF